MSEILDKIKRDLVVAMKNNDSLKKDIYRVVISECNFLESSKKQGGKPLTEQQVVKAISDIVAANEALLSHKPNPVLEQENLILNSFIPIMLNQEVIEKHLEEIKSDLISNQSEGKAIGFAVEHMKKLKLNADGKDIRAAVLKIRSVE
jgi:uncharacterized protein YqeY